ncbi:hypothetical protein ACHQM5_007914 [Ranunculus cassubicifolius]
MGSSGMAPKILLAKPGSASSTEPPANMRSRLPPPASLNLLSDSWDFQIDRILPYMSENTDFTVIGVIGTPGSGKSTIMNELYGFFDGTPSGMLPPFTTQSEEIKAMARHSTSGIEIRVSSDRLILLDTQPLFSPSVLAEMMRPDGSSTISLLNGEVLSADLAHELIGIQLALFLTSICHIILVVTEGTRDTDMWHLMLTAELLKHGIPDPSSLNSSYSHSGTEKEKTVEDYLAAPVFVHTKLQDNELAPHKIQQLRRALAQYFSSSSLVRVDNGNTLQEHSSLVLLPNRHQEGGLQYESFATVLGKLRDQVLSMNHPRFVKTVSEREWLRNSGRIWESVKNSPVFIEYNRTLHNSGMFRN